MLTANRLRLATLVLLTMSLAACGWPQFRGDGLRSGVATFEHDIDAAHLDRLQVAWSSFGRNFSTEPLVVIGHVVVAGKHTIYSLDDRTGRELWRRTDLLAPHTHSDLSQPTTGPGPTVAGTVYVTNYWSQRDTDHGPFTFGSTTYALDGDTGATIRTYDAGGARAPVVSADGWLYLSDFAAFGLEAFGPQGEHFTVDTPAEALDIVADDTAVRVAAGSSVITVAPHGCGQSTCLPVRSDLTRPTPTTEPTTIAENGRTLFAIGNGTLDAFARDGCGAATCRSRWRYTDPLLSGATMAVTGDTVYVVSGGGIRVLDAHGCGASTCAPIWSSDTTGLMTTTPVVANGLLFVGVGGALQAWDAAGCGAPTCAPIWSSPQGGIQSPVVAFGAVYFRTPSPNGMAVRKLALNNSPPFSSSAGSSADRVSAAPHP